MVYQHARFYRRVLLRAIWSERCLVGRIQMADELLAPMRAEGLKMTETDPFSDSPTQALDDLIESLIEL